MAKSGNRRRRKGGAGRRAPSPPPPPVSRRRWLQMAFGGLAVVGAGVGVLLGRARRSSSISAERSNPGDGSTSRQDAAENQPYKWRETRPVLRASLFTGIAAQTYRQAAEIPQVLDQLYCYCRCIENFGHRSLLSCFATRHGAG